MIQITIEEEEFDDETSTFSAVESTTFTMCHSLVSISKWESKWELPFLSTSEKTSEQNLSYVQMMVIDPVDKIEKLLRLEGEEMERLESYISSKHTATKFSDLPNEKPSERIITSEVIYAWMVQLRIPFECQHWHLNRLITLIKTINAEVNPKKMTKKDIQARNRRLNAERCKQLNTTG